MAGSGVDNMRAESGRLRLLLLVENSRHIGESASFGITAGSGIFKIAYEDLMIPHNQCIERVDERDEAKYAEQHRY